MTYMKHIIGFFSVLVLICLSIATTLGVVPVLSPLFGAGPKNLGITITTEDSVKSREKVGTTIVSLPANTPLQDDFRLEGKRPVDFTFTSKELTAHSNNRPWKNYPVKNVQIKIHEDGTIESSGTLIISKALPYALGLGYTETQIRDAMKTYNIPPFEVPIYILGKGSVSNDRVTVDAQTVKIGAVTIPEQIVARANTEAESVLNDLIAKHSSAFHAEEVSFANGAMHFKGDAPQTEYVITE